jgi:hypothetical protein
MAPVRSRSVLAIDPTTRGVAFVFFESGKLLDWGERLGARDLESGVRLVGRLLEEYPADVLAIEDPDATGCHRRARIRVLLRTVMTLKRRRGIRLVTVSREEVRRWWKAHGLRNKESVAMTIGTQFPELSAIVPSARRAGWNEDSRVNVFDAASLALHALDLARIGR